MIQYDFDPIQSITRVTVSGELRDAEVLSWFRGFLDDLRDAKQVSGIVDTRGVTDLNVTSETVHQMTILVEGRQDVFTGSRWAFIADQDIVFGLSRMYQLLREEAPYEIRVFREMEPAREWFEEGA
ncbi:MAG: hypothetical protein HKP30_02085 [Myxococcales bacterium]|nr:hypothetical protein [Myxococcales bacterium]